MAPLNTYIPLICIIYIGFTVGIDEVVNLARMIKYPVSGTIQGVPRIILPKLVGKKLFDKSKTFINFE